MTPLNHILCLAVSISQTNATLGMGVITVFALIWVLSGIFWWTFASSGFMVVIHAGLRDASMHQDGDDQVTMVGDIAPMSHSEQAAVLNDSHV
jgi:hypothetical protein